MKAKWLAMGLSAVFAVSLLAGCGEAGPDLNPDAQAPALSDQAVTLELNGSAGNKPREISDTLFGVFLEDINYAGYLLDDNLLYNGSFESFTATDPADGWLVLDRNSSSFKVETAADQGVLAGEPEYGPQGQSVNSRFGTVTVTAASGGIKTSGHTPLPIAITEGKEYLFSAFVKTSAAANMSVRVKESSALAEVTIPLKAGSWVKYQYKLHAAGTSDKATLEIAFDTAGTYQIDAIQLETLDATAGIKQYVYDAIRDLSPKFIRFPGGCIIEGDGGNGGDKTQEIYDWKNSVGAVQNGTNAGDDTVPALSYTLVKDGEESTATTYGEWITRRQNGDLWGYDMEYGVGFYEYFLLCESLHASAVPVLNCGLSDQGGAATHPTALYGRHGKKVDDYIQDAIDLIEFAKGGTDTKWGHIRELMGHPQPFEMDYIGIGNEQFGDYFTKYYEEFLKSEAFRAAIAKYSVKTIVGNGMVLSDCQNPAQNASSVGLAQRNAQNAVRRGVVDTIAEYGVHDQHYYVNWTKLVENCNMYDDYARPSSEPDTYYEVFVGEYSANDGDGAVNGYPLIQNGLITALSEAVMMTGYERNGDIIKLAAYAPMFGAAATSGSTGGNAAVNQWDVDMMYYTNREIVRSTNYYVQQMFMNNMGDTVLRNSSLTWKNEGDQTFTFAPTGAGAATATPKEFNKLYFVTSKTDDGDLIVKLVNLSGGSVKLNVDITNAESKGYATVTELSNADYTAVNTLREEAVRPSTHSIGWSGNSFGYELKPYSLTIFRILAD